MDGQVNLPYKHYTEKQKSLKMFCSQCSHSSLGWTLIASHHNMWFATDFVPCYTWMKSGMQTLIISCISGELSLPFLPWPPSWLPLSFQHSKLHYSHLRKRSSNSNVRYAKPLLWGYSWLTCGNIIFKNVVFNYMQPLTATIWQTDPQLQNANLLGWRFSVCVHPFPFISQPFRPTSLFK